MSVENARSPLYINGTTISLHQNELPSLGPASATALGTVKVPTRGGLNVDTDGKISIDHGSASSGQVLTWNGTSFVWSSVGSGTVTSVGLSAPSLFTVSGSPVTGSGTLSFAWNGVSTNFVLADGTTVATSTYLTTSVAASTYQPLNAKLTSISALANASGALTNNGSGTFSYVSYLTGNQTITLSGDVTGSGTTAITTSISAATVTGKALTGYTVGSNTALAATDTILAAFGKVQGQLNARSGTVTSVSLSAPSLFTVSGSPVTGSGTLAFAWNGSASNIVLANGTTVAASTYATASSLGNYLPLTAGSSYPLTGHLYLSDPGDGNGRWMQGTVGTNDFFRYGGGSTAQNAGYAEIATADDGNEPIYVRQYVGTFTTLGRTATLLDESGNTSFPGYVVAGGTSYVGNGTGGAGAGYAQFGHNALMGTYGYAIAQSSIGVTWINSASGQAINFSNNNGPALMSIGSTGTVTISSLGSGLVKATSGALSIATANSDYLTPSGFTSGTKFYQTSGWGGTSPAWRKIGTADITGQYGSSSGRCRFMFAGGNGGVGAYNAHSGVVCFRMKQQNAMTSSLDVCTLWWESATTMSNPAYFFGVKTADNSSHKTVDFYIRCDESYDSLDFVWEETSGLSPVINNYTTSAPTATYNAIGTINFDINGGTTNVLGHLTTSGTATFHGAGAGSSRVYVDAPSSGLSGLQVGYDASTSNTRGILIGSTGDYLSTSSAGLAIGLPSAANNWPLEIQKGGAALFSVSNTGRVRADMSSSTVATYLGNWAATGYWGIAGNNGGSDQTIRFVACDNSGSINSYANVAALNGTFSGTLSCTTLTSNPGSSNGLVLRELVGYSAYGAIYARGVASPGVSNYAFVTQSDGSETSINGTTYANIRVNNNAIVRATASGTQIKGMADGSSASAGQIGEIISSTTNSTWSSALTINSTNWPVSIGATPIDLSSITVTAGRWTIYANTNFRTGDTAPTFQTNSGVWSPSISLTSSSISPENERIYFTQPTGPGLYYSYVSMPIQITVSSNTLISLFIRGDNNGITNSGSFQAVCSIKAVRIS